MTMGHNQGPPFDPELHAGLSETADEFIAASQKWLDLDDIATEEVAKALTDQISGLRALFKRVEAARVDAKEPHLIAGRKVDAAFNGIKKKVETCAGLLKKKLQPYLERKAAAEAEEKRKREAEAEAARKAAEEAARKAEEGKSLAAQFEAEEAAKRAAEAEKEAKRKAENNVKSATGAGRTIALRTIREVEITNIRVLALHYQHHPELAALLKRLAEADVRAKDVDETKIPGIAIREKKTAA